MINHPYCKECGKELDPEKIPSLKLRKDEFCSSKCKKHAKYGTFLDTTSQAKQQNG